MTFILSLEMQSIQTLQSVLLLDIFFLSDKVDISIATLAQTALDIEVS